MTRALGPRAGLPPEAAVPFTVLGLAWLPVAGAGLLWTGGHLASLVVGRGWSGPGFGWEFGLGIARDGVRSAWPGVPPAAVWAVTAILVAVLGAPVVAVAVRVARRRVDSGDPLASLATPQDVNLLAGTVATDRARRLRSTLEGATSLTACDVGVLLGQLRTSRGVGPTLRASWEDVLLAVMAPRAGKTTALAIPAVLQAPGPVVATSNKADLWSATAAARQASTAERVWVFDPQHISGVARSWWWNPLAGVTTVEEAHRLAGHFIQEIRSERRDRDFWSSAAHDLLTALVLAAGTSGRDLVEVYEWLNDPVVTTPVDALRAHGHAAVAGSLLGRVHGAPETRDGIYETARTAAQCLRDPTILAWVTPARGRAGGDVEEFDAGAFPATRQTLYLLSKEGAGAAAPLVAALTDRVMREATRTAELAPMQRLDPPLVVVLDEAANVCRISDLPELYSHFGSRGITPITILQSYKQGARVWGDHGMDALWSAATIKLIGAGLDDARLAEDISRLIGDHDVPVRSISHGERRTTQTISLRRQRILAPDDVRALPRGTALLLATGIRVASLTLQPYYTKAKEPQ